MEVSTNLPLSKKNRLKRDESITYSSENRNVCKQ